MSDYRRAFLAVAFVMCSCVAGALLAKLAVWLFGVADFITGNLP